MRWGMDGAREKVDLLQSLLEQLRSPDPLEREEALRILAMVEETEAIPMVLQVFRQDPEPRIRQIAQWAGRILWQAQQRGHSTCKAMEARFARAAGTDREALFLDAVTRDMVTTRTPQELQSQIEQGRLRRELNDALYTRSSAAGTPAQEPDLSDLAADILDEAE